MESFHLLAHRGCSAFAPENTRAAFRLAKETGATHIECDARLTADKEVVLCHDGKLSRYALGEKVVEEYTLSELRAMDFGAWFDTKFAGEKIFTVKELLETFKNDFTFHIEIKGQQPELVEHLWRVIKNEQMQERCVITSFSLLQLQRMRALDKQMRLGWLVWKLDDETLRQMTDPHLKFYQICPKSALVTSEFVQQANAKGLQVRGWGCPLFAAEANAELIRLQACGAWGCTVNDVRWGESHEIQQAIG